MTKNERELLLFVALRLEKLYEENNNEKQAKAFKKKRLKVIQDTKTNEIGAIPIPHARTHRHPCPQ